MLIIFFVLLINMLFIILLIFLIIIIAIFLIALLFICFYKHFEGDLMFFSTLFPTINLISFIFS